MSGIHPPRTEPHSEQAEVGVLGSVLLDNDTLGLPDVAQLGDHDFYLERHRHIWRAMRTLQEVTAPIDLTTLSEQLIRSGRLDAAGGLGTLIGLGQQVPTSAHADHYARIVLEKRYLRASIQHSAQVIRHAYAQDIDLEDLGALQGAPPVLTFARTQVVSLSSSIGTVLEQAERGTGPQGLPTGLEALDRLTGGLEAGRLYVLAARPGMGKSGLAFQIGAHVARASGRVLAFSLEMPAEELAARIVASEARVSLEQFSRARRGQPHALQARDWARLRQAQQRLDQGRYDALAKPALTLQALLDEVRREHARQPLRLFILDYLQLVQVSGRAGEHPVQRVTLISNALKALAMELQLPVLALSQLSRAVEQRPNRRPMLSDLRESGAVEQDADVVLFIYRDEYYNASTDQPGVAELIVGKQRNGPLGECQVQFQSHFIRFQTLAAEYAAGQPQVGQRGA
ncbi:replicative DNA helicase [Deinococcus sonorensis]|uniref:DNA 5'-3' helicase n=2 Tax=Deinococcus sonorensis TaxID=309891 RepID=A0AAU7UCS8_9DEIO